jgi:4-carboxymuconolactone decarboxylase
MGGESVPLVEVPAAICKRLAEFGASDRANQALLYRALANHPEILTGWIELAWRLRQHCATPRRLRELMIVRGAQVAGCEYELRSHTDLALANGVTAAQLESLPEWRLSSTFSSGERAALALAEAMLAGKVPDDVLADLEIHFSPEERVELIVTAGFYAMVPRVVSALRLPLEERHR